MCYFPWEDGYIAERLQPLTYAPATFLNVCRSTSLCHCNHSDSSMFVVVASEAAVERGITVGQLCAWLFSLRERDTRCTKPGFDTLEAFSSWLETMPDARPRRDDQERNESHRGD